MAVSCFLQFEQLFITSFLDIHHLSLPGLWVINSNLVWLQNGLLKKNIYNITLVFSGTLQIELSRFELVMLHLGLKTTFTCDHKLLCSTDAVQWHHNDKKIYIHINTKMFKKKETLSKLTQEPLIIPFKFQLI